MKDKYLSGESIVSQSSQESIRYALTHLSEDEISFKEAIKEFAKEEIKPLVYQMDQASTINPDLIPKLFDMGIMGIEIPEEFGGLGSSFTTVCLTVEELGCVDGSVSILVDVQNTLVNNALLYWANPSQKAKYLPLLSSQWIGAYALSESSSGSDAFALKLKADKKGDSYLLNGHKLWITNAQEAQLFLVFANVDFSKGYKGITAFLVERDFEGFSVGKKESKLGIKASSTCELIFDQCRVPKENILGEIGQGYKIAIHVLNEGRIGIGAQMIGIAQGAYDATKQYILSRQQFGSPIAKFQAVQFQLAEMRMLLEAARLMVYNAARLKDAGLSFTKEAAMAKLFSSRMSEKVCSLGVDLFGGNGFTTEYPIEKYYRDAKIGQIYEGTSNMQLQTIAKMELKNS